MRQIWSKLNPSFETVRRHDSLAWKRIPIYLLIYQTAFLGTVVARWSSYHAYGSRKLLLWLSRLEIGCNVYVCWTFHGLQVLLAMPQLLHPQPITCN